MSHLELVRGDGIQVVRGWAGGNLELPNLWLRDNCQCSECRVTQTTEKKFHIVDIPVDLEPASVLLEDGELLIEWPDGHRSSYALGDIEALIDVAQPAWQVWPDPYRPQPVDWTAFLADDIVAAKALEDYLASGVLLLADAPVEAGTLEALAPRLGPIREVLFERIHNVEVDPDGYNVAHTTLPLPPHNDFASYTWPPSVQALHMLANETQGGESVLVDGWQILENLRRDQPDHFAALCNTPVPFREFDADNETFSVMPMVRCDSAGNIDGLRYSNQLMQAMDPTRPGVVEFYRAYHELSRRVMSGEARTCFRLEGGQILVLQAHRVLHGRQAFTANARRHLQDAYYEQDNVRNHLTVVRRRMNNG